MPDKFLLLFLLDVPARLPKQILEHRAKSPSPVFWDFLGFTRQGGAGGGGWGEVWRPRVRWGQTGNPQSCVETWKHYFHGNLSSVSAVTSETKAEGVKLGSAAGRHPHLPPRLRSTFAPDLTASQYCHPIYWTIHFQCNERTEKKSSHGDFLGESRCVWICR